MSMANRNDMEPDESQLARPRNLGGLITLDGPYSQEDFDEPQGLGGKYLRICQRQSDPFINEYVDVDGKSWLGQFYLVGSEEGVSTDEDEEFDAPLDRLTIVPLAGAAKRNLWVRVDGKGEIRCQAIGRKYSELIGEGRPGGPCKECDKAKWKTDEEGNRYTECDRVYSYVIYVVEWGEVCVWDTSRTTSPIGREMHKWLSNRGGGSIAGGLTNTAMEFWATEVTKADYDTDGTSIYIREEAKVKRETAPAKQGTRQRGRQNATTSNTWFVPEGRVLEGTLEENNIILPIETEEGESDDSDDLPF